MNTKLVWKIFNILTLLILTSCAASPPTGTMPTQPVPTPALTDTPLADMANPASAFCVEQGFRSEIRTAADGSQSGVCIFPDGSECDEWAFFRAECSPTPPATNVPVAPTETIFTYEGNIIPQSVSMPAGAVIDPRNDTLDATDGLLFYNTDGLILGELLAPRGGYAHAAGHYQGSLSFPLVFHANELEGQKHYLNLNSGSTPTDPGGQISLLVPLDDKDMLSGLVGVPGEPVLFYIAFQPILDKVRSVFMLGTLDSIVAAPPVLILESNESGYWKPVAIQMKAGVPNGLWFTRTPWGIGGEIIFEYNEGMSFFNLTSGKITEILPPEARFSSLSEDQTWVAYSRRTDIGSEFLILDLRGGEPISLPALPESDRGAGDGIFSPTNKYIAWREAQGTYVDGNFHQTIRIATLEGQIVGDFKDVPFFKTAGFGDGTEVIPVGWLNDENLLVQVVAPEKPGSRGTVVKLNVINGEFTLFAQGFFAGWFYP